MKINLDDYTDFNELFDISYVLQNLASYGYSKARQMQIKKMIEQGGNQSLLASALEYENTCNSIYKTLPDWAKWK